MFTCLSSVKRITPKQISIDQLIDLIKNNPNKEQIEYLHSLEYKSNEYKSLKKQFPCIKAHGVFNGLGDIDMVSLAPYLYFDIDGLSNDTLDILNDTKQRLNDTFPFIHLVSKSIGGRGLFFMVNVEGLTKLNHHKVWRYFVDVIFKDFNIDRNAYSLSRNIFIPYDTSILYKGSFDRVSFSIEKGSLSQEIEDNYSKISKSSIVKVSPPNIGIHYTLNDTLSIIPLKELYTQIKTKTEYTKGITGSYTIDEMPSYTILIPREIKDGHKHKVYTRIVYALIYLNTDITLQQIVSYLSHVNEYASPKWDLQKITKHCVNIYNKVIETGEIRISTRTKKIHFNNNMKIESREKMVMAAKINGILKTNKVIDRIEIARQELLILGQNATQKRISEMIGVSLSTVKRNWTKEKQDPNSITLNKCIKPDEPEIDEDSFLQPIQTKTEIEMIKDFIKENCSDGIYLDTLRFQLMEAGYNINTVTNYILNNRDKLIRMNDKIQASKSKLFIT